MYVHTWFIYYKTICSTPSGPSWIWSFMFNFPSSVALFTSSGCDLWVEGPLGWQFYLDPEKLARPCQASQESFMAQDMWHSTIGRSLGSKRPFVFRAVPLYKSIFFLSFLYFQLKPTIRVPLSSLSDKRTRLVTASVVHAPSLFIFQFWWVFSLSHLEENFPFLYFYFILDYVLQSSTIDLSVLGFTVTCKLCLVHQVTSHLSVRSQWTWKSKWREKSFCLFSVLKRWGSGDGCLKRF